MKNEGNGEIVIEFIKQCVKGNLIWSKNAKNGKVKDSTCLTRRNPLVLFIYFLIFF